MLADRLKKDGHKVLVTKEPTNSLIGGLIRGALTHEWKASNRVVQLLCAADRGHHVEREIKPALKRGFIVLCDRYSYSSIAYGSIDLPMPWLMAINKGYPEPNYAFYIDVSPKEALHRIHAGRFEIELYEKAQALTLVAKTYKSLTRRDADFHAIKGERDIVTIHEEIYRLCCDKVIGYCPMTAKPRSGRTGGKT